MWIM
ncbi:hypothetical protein KGM_209705A, partial [Danaus plexippus plexippus]